MKFFWISALLFFSYRVFAGSLTAEVDSTSVQIGESLHLTVTLEGKFDDDRLPFEDLSKKLAGVFEVTQNGTQDNLSIVNGHMSRTKVYTLSLTALKEGKQTLPSMELELDGKKESTLPITIDVQGGGNAAPPVGNSGGNNVGPSGTGPVSVEYIVPEGKYFQGQPIPATVKIYARARVRDISNANTSSPEFRVISLKGEKQAEEIVGGERLFTVTLSQFIIPLKSGKLKKPVFSVNVSYEKESSMRKKLPFGGFFGGFAEFATKTFTSQSEDIVISPLPEPRPKNFSDAVGDFTLGVDSPNKHVKIGDTLTFMVTVQGEGSLDVMKDIVLPDSLKNSGKIFAEKPQLEEASRSGTLQSKRVQKYAFIPKKSGTINFGALDVTVFDYKEQKYKTLQAPLGEFVIEAASEEEKNIAPTSVPKDSEEKIAVPKGEAVSSIKIEKNQSGISSALTILLICFFSSISFLLGWFLKALKSRPARFKTKSEALLFRSFKSALKKSESPESVLLALRNYFAAKEDADPRALTPQEVVNKCKNISPELGGIVEDLRSGKIALTKDIKKKMIALLLVPGIV